jgi:hypothetical protein
LMGLGIFAGTLPIYWDYEPACGKDDGHLI